MSWPSVLPNSAAFDNNADSVAASRPELKKMSDAVNILASNVYTGLATSGTVTPDAANGEIQVVTLSGNMTINAFANPIAGQIINIVFKQPAAGSVFNLSSTIPFENGNESLTPLNSAVDMATITFDGTNYYGVMLNAFGTNEVYPFEFNVVGDDSSGDSLQIGSIGGSTLQFVGSGGTTVSVGAGPVVTIAGGGAVGLANPLNADLVVNNKKIKSDTTNPNISIDAFTGVFPGGIQGGTISLLAKTISVNEGFTSTSGNSIYLQQAANGYIVIEEGANAQIVLNPAGTGAINCSGKKVINANLSNYAEQVYNLGNISGNIQPDSFNGNTQTARLTGNITFIGFLQRSPADGKTITLILQQDGTGGRTFIDGLDSAGRMLFAGGVSTLSTGANAVDIMTISYIGGTYYASINKGYV